MALEVLPSGLKTVVSDDGLEVRVYYLECLAQATFIISHEGSAFIVDPRRDVDAFLADLKTNNLSLKGILETHFHADFVSGHYELMQRTGATIYFGPGSSDRCKFPHHQLADNEMIDFSSRYAIRVLHTPGHTPESVVYLVVDITNNNRPLKAFTGDTLFIGSCGRPDLVGSVGFTAEQMSKLMFSSLKNKICTLPDDVQVFPAHGAGSPCGKNLSADLYSTIGKEKLTNPALQYTDEDEFVKFLTTGQPDAPQYFGFDVQQNISGAPLLAEELAQVPRVSALEFKALMDSGSCTTIDTRNADDFAAGYMQGALNFPLGDAGGTIVGPEDGNFAIWIGTLVSSSSDILLICDPGKEGEGLQRLSRIGYTKVKAVLEGGMASYRAAGLPLASTTRINLKTGDPLETYLGSGRVLVDVRTGGEVSSNTGKGALNLPLAEIYSLMERKLDKKTNYIAFCKAGFRSAIASSVLRKAGYSVQDIIGGFAAINVYAPTHTTTGEVCPSMKAVIDAMEKR